MAQTPTGSSLQPPGSIQTWTGLQNYLRLVYEAIRRLHDGKIGSTGSVTLTANTTTTTLTDAKVGGDSVITFMPTTANAALEFSGMISLDTAAMYVSARAQGSATLTHADSTTTDRTFKYVILG
jgi:hypothetical protein